MQPLTTDWRSGLLYFPLTLIIKFSNNFNKIGELKNLLTKQKSTAEIKKKKEEIMWNGKFVTDVRKSNLKQASVLEALARLRIYFIPDQWIKFVQQFNCFFSFL